MSSESNVTVVRIGKIEPHPNADRLQIVNVHDGYPSIIASGQFKEGDLAAYVPVDSVVDTARPEFAFLAPKAKPDGTSRIRAAKIRSVFSMGLLVAAPVGFTEGADVAEALGVTKWLPPAEREHGKPTASAGKTRSARVSETARFDRTARLVAFAAAALVWIFALIPGADLVDLTLCAAWSLVAIGVGRLVIQRNRTARKKPVYTTYDIEGLRRHANVFEPGELVHIGEKLHGVNISMLHTGKRFWVRSRTVFREKGTGAPGFGIDGDVWTKMAVKHDLERKLKAYPNKVLFGEVYGAVQDLKYGVPPEEGVRFAAFDVLDLTTGKYLDVQEFADMCARLGVPTAPSLHVGPWDPSLVKLAEGKSTLPGANHVREGFVVRPLRERHSHIGRVQLKLAGEGYLCRKEAA